MTGSQPWMVSSVRFPAIAVGPLNNEQTSSNPATGSNLVPYDWRNSSGGRRLHSSSPESPNCLPCPLLGCFNGLPLGPRVGRYQGTIDAHAGRRGSHWSQLFVVGIPFAGLLGTWFSNAQIAEVERQIVKLQCNRGRIQRRRRDRDRYDAR